MHAVTFYSYKGGVGRSLLVANCAIYLAELGFKVVALDLDLEAPGLHYKFRAALPDGFTPARGVVNLIDDYITRNELYESLADTSFVVPLGETISDGPAPKGSLRVIPAGAAPSFEYWRRVANIDWKRFLYDEGATGLEFFVDLRDRIAEEFTPDILLIDSRTGITEIGNLATTVLADKVVCVVTDTAENLDGARAVLRGLRRHRRLSDEKPIEMMVAVSRPHASLSISERLERIRAFLEEPADMLEATLKVGAPYPLTYQPEVEQSERLVVGSEMEQSAQLFHDYVALVDELVPESLWTNMPTGWLPRGDSPYPYSVWSYSKLALEQPSVPIDGLYRVGRLCSIVVPGFTPEMRANDGRPLAVWFEKSAKVIGVRLPIVDRVPDRGLRVPDPTLKDLVELRDFPFPVPKVDDELALRLPPTFPSFHCMWEGSSSLFVHVERELLAGERTDLRKAVASFSYGSTQRLAVRVDTSVGKEETKPRSLQKSGILDLIPSRWLPKAYSTAVRGLAVQDEDIWMSSRHRIYTGEITTPSSLLPPPLRERKARLLADLFESTKLGAWRLIPFYEQILIQLPVREASAKSSTAINGVWEDILALARAGRVSILLPNALDRYEPALLNELAEQAPEAILFPRALCGATMVELRRRLRPWFFPDFDLRERYERLNRISRRSEEGASTPGFLPPNFASFLSRVWSDAEVLTHLRGTKALLSTGFGALFAEKIQHDMARDLSLESIAAGSLIEQSSALSAVSMPTQQDEFSLLGLTKLSAAYLSLLSNGFPLAVPSIMFNIQSQDIPIRDLASLDSEPLRNIRTLIADLISGLIDGASANRVVSACNEWLASAESPMSAGSELLFRSALIASSSTPFLRRAADPSLPRNQAGNAMRSMRDTLAGGEAISSTSGTSEIASSFPSVVVAELPVSRI
jgi:MinD-like ATPase involved in chromosome partitioning or flagellar assembly